ncbi:MAG: class I SAM-dependent methyltransferase [Pseudomonadota bacterium]
MITINFSLLDLEPGYRVLDAGCGTGRHLAEAARCRDLVAIGSDILYEDLVQARNRLNFHQYVGETGGGPWSFLTADVTDLPYADESFDLVICAEVLEHIPDHNKALAELVRVLKPGRNLVVSVPRFWPERLCWTLSRDYHRQNGGHVRIYQAGQLIRMAEKAGVIKWAAHFAHALHSPYWWLKCLVGPEREDCGPVNLYHQLLVWDMMKKPRITRLLERMLNPIIGKSLVLYFRKVGATLSGRPI